MYRVVGSCEIKEFTTMAEAVAEFNRLCFKHLNKIREDLKCDRSIESIKKAYPKKLLCGYKISENDRAIIVRENDNITSPFGFDLKIIDTNDMRVLDSVDGNIDDLWGLTDGKDYLSSVPDAALSDNDSMVSIAEMIRSELPPVICAEGQAKTSRYPSKLVALLAYLKGYKSVNQVTEEELEKYDDFLCVILDNDDIEVNVDGVNCIYEQLLKTVNPYLERISMESSSNVARLLGEVADIINKEV